MNVMHGLRRAAAVAAALALAGTLASCGGDEPADDTDSDTVNVLLPYPLGLSWTGLLVGQEAGFFEAEGLTVTTDSAEGSGFVVQQVISGNVKFGLAASSEAMVAFENDPSLRAIFCNKHKNIFRVVVPENSDVQSISDLAGKTLGITERGGGEDTIAKAALAGAGLEENADVKILPIGGAGPQAKSAIERGQVDAYAASFPNVISLTISGVKFRDITPAEFEDMPGDCLIAKESTLENEEDADKAVRLARAWSQGMAYAIENSEEALEMACANVAEACADQAYAEAYWEYNRDLLLPAEGSKPGALTPSGWELVADLMYETGVTPERVDVTPHISGGIVGEIQEEWQDYDLDDVQVASN